MDHNFNETTVDELLNRSLNVNPKLLDIYVQNRVVQQPAAAILIAFYGILIFLGAIGNTLVILSVIRKPAMRTPRNMFIVNLAVSDLLLCAVTMPLTLMEILTKYFPLGNNTFLCKLFGALQATSVFVSAITITAIALDRYQVIVYPTSESLQLFGALLILLMVWILALVLAFPLFIFRNLEHFPLNINNTALDINYCFEDWPGPLRRYHYSIFTLIFQYCLPIIIVSVAYILILIKLRHRFTTGFVAKDASQGSRKQHRERRLNRTNTLLISIAVIFFVSWLPLNLFNLIADLGNIINFNEENIRIIYAVCHMMGMSSACSNPILYGWLNENFWKEFQDIMCINKGGSIKTTKRLSLRKEASRTILEKPDLVADSRPGTSVNTEMSHLSKC